MANKTTPSAATQGVIEMTLHASPSNKLDINQSNGSTLLGKNASIIVQLPCFRQGVEIAPSAMTLGVVDVAPYASPSNKLGINQIERIDLVGKDAIVIANDHQRSRREVDKARRGCSLRQTHGKKSVYIKHARGRSLHVFGEIYNPNLVTHGLQIDSKEKGHLSARRSDISEHFLMGRTCAGSECSKSLEHLGPRDIVVDTIPVL
jgi:hypothetical protein